MRPEPQLIRRFIERSVRQENDKMFNAGNKTSKRFKLLSQLLVGLLIITATAFTFGQNKGGQSKQYQPAAPPPPSEPTTYNGAIVSPDEDYEIGSADIVEIRIIDAPELSGTFRVNKDGTLVLPFLGEVSSKNKTPRQLQQIIANGLREQYLTDPQVVVTVKQSNSRSFFIQGAIRRPGVYQIEGHPSLLKLITVAGGLNDNFGSTAFIIRPIKHTDGDAKPPAPETNDSRVTTVADRNDKEDKKNDKDDAEASPRYELVRANIGGLLRGNFDQNVVIEPGDIVHIPPTDVFFVAGEVNSPGSFPLKEGTTLRQAISLAQGTTFKGALKNGTIFRENLATGVRSEIKVDVGAVMNGKREDIPILANDIIIVPNSRVKSISNTLLNGFGASGPFVLATHF
jgi:polysaccharide export outer membrane protein